MSVRLKPLFRIKILNVPLSPNDALDRVISVSEIGFFNENFGEIFFNQF